MPSEQPTQALADSSEQDPLTEMHSVAIFDDPNELAPKDCSNPVDDLLGGMSDGTTSLRSDEPLGLDDICAPTAAPEREGELIRLERSRREETGTATLARRRTLAQIVPSTPSIELRPDPATLIELEMRERTQIGVYETLEGRSTTSRSFDVSTRPLAATPDPREAARRSLDSVIYVSLFAGLIVSTILVFTALRTGDLKLFLPTLTVLLTLLAPIGASVLRMVRSRNPIQELHRPQPSRGAGPFGYLSKIFQGFS